MGGSFVFAVCFVDCETLLTCKIHQGLHLIPDLCLVAVNWEHLYFNRPLHQYITYQNLSRLKRRNV